MECVKTGEWVLNADCEECVHHRCCDPVCAKRRLIFGRPDDVEPLWAYSMEEVKQSNEDLSWFWNSMPEFWHKSQNMNCKDNRPNIPDGLRWDVWERDDFTCQHCGKRRHLSIDHVIPRAKGGETTRENCQTLCKRCNSKKGASNG